MIPASDRSLGERDLLADKTGRPMRYFFNLVRDDETIRDETGVETPDLAKLRSEVLTTLDELRGAESHQADEWEGWRLEVVTEHGELVWTIEVGENPPNFRDPPSGVPLVIH